MKRGEISLGGSPRWPGGSRGRPRSPCMLGERAEAASRGANPVKLVERSDQSRRIVSSVLALLFLTACGGPTPPPAPGQSRGVAPDLRGSRVMVLPVQQNLGVRGDLDAEIAFALTGREDDIEWVLRAEVDEILNRSPGIQARTRGLPVSMFLQAEVERVGDPLFGQLRRMAGLVDAQAVLLPVQASFEPPPGVVGGAPRVRLQAALIEPRTGRVYWYGVEQGGEFTQDDPRAIASAVENLTRALLWYAGG